MGRSGPFVLAAFTKMETGNELLAGGDFGEANPWQMPMGRAVQPVLEAMGVRCLRVETATDVRPVTEAALTMAFQSEIPVAILLSQRLIGAKAF